MAELFDPITGKRVNIEDDAKEAAFLSGKYAVDNSKPIFLESPEGEVFKARPDVVAQALRDGFRFEGAFNQAKREYREEERASPISSAIKTAAINFGDELALGIPDFALDLQKEEFDPKTKQLTLKAKRQILREENPVANFIGGATGFGLSLTYGGPVLGAVTKTGQAAERGILEVAKVAGKEAAENIATRAIAKAGNYAAQGAVASTPYVATALALGEPEAAAEVLIAGAGMGVGIGAAGALISPIAGALKTARMPDPEKATAYLENLAKRQGLKAVGALTSEFKQAIKIERKIAGDPKMGRDEALGSFYDYVHNRLGVPRNKMKQFAGADLVEKHNEFRAKVQQERDEILNKIDQSNPEGIIDYDEQLSLLEQLRQKYSTNVGASTGELADIEGAINAMTDAYTQKLRASGVKFGAPGEIMSKEQLLQYAVNNPVPKLTLLEMERAKREAAKELFKSGKPVSNAASEAYSALNDLVENSANFVMKNKQLDGELGTKFRQNGKDYQRVIEYDKVIENIANRNESNRLVSPFDLLTGAATDSATLGAGSFLYRQYGARAGEAALFGAAKVIDKTGDRVVSAINRAAGLDKEPLKRAAKLGSVNILGKLFDEDDTTIEKRKKLQVVGAELARLQQSPELINDAVSAFTKDLAELKDGDQIIAHYGTKVADGIAYLANSIPKPNVPNTPFNNRPFIPTDRELSQFERRIQAVLDPVSVLDEIVDGTATKEQMEALKVVYPQFHKKIVDAVVDTVSSSKAPVPDKARRKLMMLIEPMGTQLYDPQKTAQLQSNFAPKEKAKPRANSKITEASRGGTDIDRIIYER